MKKCNLIRGFWVTKKQLKESIKILLRKNDSLRKENDEIKKSLDLKISYLSDALFEKTELTNKFEKQIKEIELLKRTNKEYQILHQEYENKIIELKTKNRKSNSAIGGYVGKINRLIKQVEFLKKEIDSFKENKWLVKELPKEKPKNIQVMGVKRGCQNTQVKKELKEKNEINL